jgi:hypothetical protein
VLALKSTALVGGRSKRATCGSLTRFDGVVYSPRASGHLIGLSPGSAADSDSCVWSRRATRLEFAGVALAVTVDGMVMFDELMLVSLN